MRYLILTLIISLSGCSIFQPKVDECASYDTTVKKSYCYSSKEVTALRLATAQSYQDGAITKEQAISARDVLNIADEHLDLAESLILTGDDVQATESLESVANLLRALK